MDYLDNLIAGLVSSVLIGVLAYQRQALSLTGVVGAITIGTLVFGFGGWVWGLILITFFVTSSALSHYKASGKAHLAVKYAKGHHRDLGQTLANGSVGALFAIGFALWNDPVLFCGFVGAVATVNADTWATELGVLCRTPPRLITSGEIVQAGASGGVSWLGLLASAGGALTIGIAALVFCSIERTLGAAPSLANYWMLIPVAVTGGMAGSLLDSVLGARVQAIYLCPRCAKETEATVHRCGSPTQHRRGWHWLNNDAVNLISSAFGALVAAGLCFLLR